MTQINMFYTDSFWNPMRCSAEAREQRARKYTQCLEQATAHIEAGCLAKIRAEKQHVQQLRNRHVFGPRGAKWR